jgi:uncharacterized protein with gpF-like domain
MVPEWNAEQAIRWGYLSNLVLYRASTVVAEALSGCAFRAGSDPDRPTQFSSSARLAQLLGPTPGGPAPKISARMLWAHATVQYLVTGRFGWEIETTPQGQVAALWPLVARYLEPIPTETGARSIEYFQGFFYGTGGSATRKRLPVDRVFYVWKPGQNDWREPESAVQAARLDVSTAVMQGRYDYAFLNNGAVPAHIVTHLEFATQEDKDAFRQQFQAEHLGPDRAGKTMFMEAEAGENGELQKAIDIQVVGLSQRDQQAAERLKEALRNIALAVGVPWSLLDASGRTYDNASAEWVNFWTVTMMPLMATLQDHVNMELAPRLGNEVGWFDLSKVEALKPKRKFLPISPDRAVNAGLAAIDEWREDVGLNPLPNGDGMWKKPEPKPVLIPTAEPTAITGEEKAPLQLVAAAPSAQTRSADPAKERAKKATSFEGQARALESMWERSLKALFKRQQTAVLSRLEGKRGRQALRASADQVPDASAVFSEAFWRTETEELAHGLYEAVFAAGAARLSGELGVGLPERAKRDAAEEAAMAKAFDVESQYAQSYIDGRANQLAGQVTETTYKGVKTAMAEGVGQGEGIPDLAERIKGVFETASDLRSRTIARTEVISGYNGSVNLVASQLGPDIVSGKEWLSAHDSRTREDHATADGQVVGINDAFDVGGEALEYPGDPAGSAGQTVNCRCSQVLLTAEEMAERAKRRVSVRTVTRLAARVKLGKMTPEEAIAEMERAPQLELVG